MGAYSKYLNLNFKQMKKALSLAVLLFVGLAVNAQTSTTITTTSTPGLAKWRFGIKGTLGGSWLKSNKSNMEYASPGFQYSGGLQIEKSLSKTVSFVTGIDISAQGGKVSFGDSAHAVLKNDGKDYYMKSRSYNFQSIDIPLSLKLKTSEIGYLTYWMQVGVMPSIMWKATASKNTYDNGGGVATLAETNGDDKKLDVRNDCNLFRASIIAGLGVEYNLAGSTSLLLGIHYVDGFTSTVLKESKTLYTSNWAHLNQKQMEQSLSSKYIMLTAGLLF